MFAPAVIASGWLGQLTVFCIRCSVSPATATDVLGLEGHEVNLPCDTAPPPDDTTLIVLWYRADLDAPVYR